ncbi:MAG: ABC transporter permease [Defluviitaleaceae bacterium]|nr:ABC transporter permease [Defluviitaleaceae bacterium]
MKALLKRNIKLYFRDKAALFFSFLSIIIIIALFALFLGQGGWDDTDIRDTWLMAGIMAVAAITLSIGAYDIVITDKLDKIAKGFYASPVKRSHITAAYVFSPFIVSVMMSFVVAIGFFIYLFAVGAPLPGAMGMVQLALLIILSNFAGTAVLGFLISFVKSTGSWNTIGTLIGTLSGFLMGVYMPIGQLPSFVQYIMIVFPPYHSAMLFRQILMSEPLAAAYYTYGSETVAELQGLLGVTFNIGNFEVTPIISVVYLAATAVLFFCLSVLNMRKLSK